jgi:hypothetical protein
VAAAAAVSLALLCHLHHRQHLHQQGWACLATRSRVVLRRHLRRQAACCLLLLALHPPPQAVLMSQSRCFAQQWCFSCSARRHNGP